MDNGKSSLQCIEMGLGEETSNASVSALVLGRVDGRKYQEVQSVCCNHLSRMMERSHSFTYYLTIATDLGALSNFFFFFKMYLFYVYECTVAVFRHTRRGHRIPLQVVVRH